jgi:ankyrin repeat protein
MEFPTNSTPAIDGSLDGAPIAEQVHEPRRVIIAEDDSGPTSALICAAMLGDEEAVKQQLDKGADPSGIGSEGMTSLHGAAQCGHKAVVSMLLARGADLSVKGREGWTVLHAAAVGGDVAINTLLLDRGADIHAATDDGTTILHVATQLRHEVVVELLLQRGADVSAATKTGATALHVAAAHIQKSTEGEPAKILELLLKYSSDPSPKDQSGLTPLYAAAANGQIAAVDILLNAGAAASAERGDGSTPLHIAVRKNHAVVVRRLLEQGADASAKDKYGSTPLHVAARAGEAGLVSLLLQNGADASAKDNEGMTPLHITTREGHNEATQMLLSSQDTKVSEKCNRGLTALHFATLHGELYIIEALLERGAEASAKDDSGCTSLLAATTIGSESICKLLLDHKAEVSVKFELQNGRTPLIAAAEDGHEGIVKLLLERGANVSETNDSGCTALHKAAENGHTDVIDLLIKEHADIGAKDKEECTPLHLAAAGKHIGAIMHLLEQGAAISEKRNKGFTAFDDAVVRGDEEVVKVFLSQNREMLQGNADGHTSLHLAAECGHESIAKLLIQNGANVAAENSKGWTVIHAAAAGGNTGVIKTLLDGGAKLSADKYDGWTVLHAAAQMGHEEAFKVFLDCNAELSARNNGWTPLHIAAKYGRLGMIVALLEHGVSVSEENLDGGTALHLAAEFGHEAIVKCLVDHGAEILAVDKDGLSPLQVARENKHDAIINLLEQHLAEPPEKSPEEIVHFSETTDKYQYPPLENNSGYIRLFHVDSTVSKEGFVTGHLTMESLEKCPQYIAISYTWGESQPEEKKLPNKHPISIAKADHLVLIDGCVLRVTTSLHYVLKRYRRTAEKVFWVDQICINQQNNDEISQQVRMMSKIYTQAKMVFIWLGHHDVTTEKGIAMAKFVCESKMETTTTKSGISRFWFHQNPGLTFEQTWDPWLKLFSKRWWTRQWVVQEYVCARAHRFFCGDYEIPEKLLLTGLLLKIEKEIPPQLISENYGLKTKLGNFEDMLIIRSDPSTFDRAEVSWVQSFDCSNPRDKIYGMLGIGRYDDKLPIPNYDLPVELVYEEYARYFIQSGRGSKIILRAGLEQATLELPTWCPDWSSKKHVKRSRDRVCKGADELSLQISLTDPSLVTIDGTLIDRIRVVGPPLQEGHITKINDDYRVWFHFSEGLIQSLLDRGGYVDGDVNKLWCRLIMGTSSVDDEELQGFIKYHKRLTGRSISQDEEAISLQTLSLENENDTPNQLFIDASDTIGERNIAELAETHKNSSLDAQQFEHIIACNNCQVCITEKGYLGLVGEGTKPGDFISVLFGVPTLKTLRVSEKSQDRFQNVSSAFILPKLGEDLLDLAAVRAAREELVLE